MKYLNGYLIESVQNRRNFQLRRSFHLEYGMTLLELLVGITLGAMVIAAALGTLVMSRSVSGTTDEVATIQQDAVFALNVMGRLIRQTGSLEPVASRSIADTPVIAFQDREIQQIVGGTQGTTATAPDTLLIGTQSGVNVNANIDCFGNTVTTREFTSTFSVNSTTNELMCATNGGTPQALIPNVIDFEVQYRVTKKSFIGNYDLNLSQNAPATPNSEYDPFVTAIQICLELRGAEFISDTNATYTNCRGNSVSMGKNLRRVYRNVFYVRAS